MPYIVGFVVSSIPSFTFPSTYEGVRFQFTLVSDEPYDLTECAELLDKLRTTYDFTSLSFAGSDADYYSVECRPDIATGPLPVEERMVATQDYLIIAQRAA